MPMTIDAVEHWFYLVQMKDGYYHYEDEKPDFNRYDDGTLFFHIKPGVSYFEVLEMVGKGKNLKPGRIRQLNLEVGE